MSKSTTTLSAGNGNRISLLATHGIEESGREPLLNPFAELALGKAETKREVTINLNIEVHEHKYFIDSPQAIERPAYTAVSTSAAPREIPRAASDEDMQAWRREVGHFERLRDALWKDRNLRNKFVAVRNGQVVDHDADEFVLARRIFRNYPGEVVLIKRVQRRDRIVEMPSPERD